VGDHAELGFLHEWLSSGYAGGMGYMAELAHLRADVRRLLPGARSVVVTGTLYNTRPDTDDTPVVDGEARVARYAWGEDYHDVLRDRINRLEAWMREVSAEPFEACAFVDSGPVQERVYALYAGLGFIGKNTCLINPELGSFLFLSEIITTLRLEPDAQGLDGCGSCTRCLDACPTQALVGPHVLDATRCLSYLTIELREAVPEALRPDVGAHIFGCDICQTVCPYNQAPSTSTDPAWQPRHGLDHPSLAALWRCSDDELQALTRGSALKRAKLDGLRRNLAVAIGNAGDAEAVAALCLPNEDRPSAETPLVREHVEWALDRHR
jgi:epoxyqueuosine reductase